jgi:hypothetical protein
MAMDPEAEFKQELEVFGNEVEEAIQSFYAEQTIHNVALEANAVIVLGQIFDRDPRAHTINRVLQLATQNPATFSKTALEKRKLPQAGKDTAEFVRTAYVPKKGDFQRLQKYADKQRAIYNGHYLALRNKFFTHRERVDLTAAFAKANIRRLGRLLVSLDQLQDALWELFVNGRKPVLRPRRHSGRQILKSPLPKGLHRNQATQEWIAQETKTFLKHISALTRQGHRNRLR